ncbi:MAG: hypothetical protein ACOCWM_03755 [Cyclobacteriaceae bacterium]
MFTSENQPENRGRKPSKLKKFLKENGMTADDLRLLISNTLLDGQTQSDIEDILKDKNQPMIIRLFVRAFLEDFKKGELKNFDLMMGRVMGKPKEFVHHSGNVATKSKEELEKELKRFYAENKEWIKDGDY